MYMLTKRSILSTLLLICSWAMLAQDSLFVPPAQATLLLEEQAYHMGTIRNYKEPAVHTFFYCNVGTEGLIIKRIEASCGCKVLQYPTDSLFYDESGSIEVAVMPCKETGDFKKGIYVYTNAGTFRLQLSGKFILPYSVDDDYTAIPTEEEEALWNEEDEWDDMSGLYDEDIFDRKPAKKKKKKNRKKSSSIEEEEI